MHPVVGAGRRVAGRYRLMEPIGRGAMGIVWRGRDEVLARDVAVKEVQLTSRASPSDAEALYQRTLREARTAAQLSHPNVVTVFDVVEDDGSPWIVMELVDARSLDQVIAEEGPLPPERAAGLGTGLIGALATAHAAGVLHRDVKPSNVLVTADGQAVLTDFGIATFAGDLSLTQTGMVVGTPGFTAPERVRGHVATPASDLWSLGATLYTAVEGRGPFDRAGGSTVITAGVAAEDAPRAPSAGPLGPVIDALLSRDPDARPDSATAARLLADAASAARTGPLPLREDSVPAAAGGRARNAGAYTSAAQLSAEGSGFLDPPDYSVLHVPDAPGSRGDEALGTLAADPEGGSAPASRWAAALDAIRSSARWRVILAAAGIAAIVAAAFAGWSIFQHSGQASALGNAGLPGSAAHVAAAASGGSGAHGTTGDRSASPPPGNPASGSPGMTTGEPGASPRVSGAPTPSTQVSPSPSPPPLPAGYRWHQFPATLMGSTAGFQIGMPATWTQSVRGQAAKLIQPARGFVLSVNLAAWQYSTPQREAEYLASQASAAHRDEFRVLQLSSVDFQAVGGYRSAAAEELKFRWHNAALGINVTQLDLLVTLSTSAGSQPYVFALKAPSGTFPAADGVFQTALPTFRTMPS
jgi:eukaryotic-like serine/threonine-protein kinase